MKRFTKVLLLGAIAIGMMTGCEFGKKSSQAASVTSSSENTTSSILSTSSVSSAISSITSAFSSNSSSSAQSSSTQVSSSTPVSSSSVAPEITWTEEQRTIMSQHLNGIVLPYTGYEESVVAYDEEKEIVTIIGGSSEGNFVKAYADLLIANGFTKIQATEDETAFVLEKAIVSEGSTRYVRVAVGAENGVLSIAACDPYFYTYPSVYGNYFAYMIGSDYVAPAFEGANYYEIDPAASAVYCYLESNTMDCGYTETLRTAGWKLASARNSKGYFVAVAPDYSYEINYIYKNTEKRFVIIFQMVATWQPNFFAEFFANNNAYAFEVPVFQATGASFLFMESGTNALVGVSGIRLADMQNYANKVREAGWKVSQNKDATSFQARLTIEDKGIALMSFGFDQQSNSGAIVVSSVLEPLPGTVFPSKEIAKMLGSFVTDVVPVYEGEATGYSAYRRGTNFYIRVEVEEGTEPAAREAYIHTILASGYDLEAGYTYTYVSPNRQIFLQASGTANSGALIITVWYVLDETETWPTEKLATIFGEDVVDVLPEYVGGDVYTLSPEENGELNLWVTLADDADYDEAVADYINILEANGYAHAYDDQDDDPHYVTENGQLDVCPWTDYSTLNLYIKYPATNTDWPEEFIADLFSNLDFEDELPIYEGEFNRVNYGYLGDIVYINVRLDDPLPADIVEAFDGYIATLEEAQFIYVKEDVIYGDQVYNSPNEEYSVTVSPRTYGFRIELAGPESVDASSEFPMAEIIECIPEAENVLPIIASGEGIAFHTEGPMPGYIDVYAVYEDTDLLEGAYTAYIALLAEAQFTEGDYYGDQVYYSPNNDFYVMVDYDAERGLWLGIGSVEQTIKQKN